MRLGKRDMPDGRTIANYLAVALPALALAIFGWQRRWVADDAFINFRIVDNLIAGHGPVFNEGERVEAYTSTLWLVMVAIADALNPFAQIEWTSVLLGLGLSVIGIAAAGAGAVVLARSDASGRGRPVVPIGMVVFVALPPAWDFATSGLETGLSFAWIGCCFLALARLDERAREASAGQAVAVRRRWMLATSALAGLGPLIRPDLAVYSGAFLLALLAVGPDRTIRGRALLVGVGVCLPLAYQVFRMGYFAAVVPNTAIAKEAGSAYWSRGWDYLVDFVSPYALWLPLGALAIILGLWVSGTWSEGRRRTVVVALAPAVAGLVHALFVVRVGGDFMHGRLLLFGLFGLAAPVTVPVGRLRATALGVGVIVWSVVCAAGLRAEYPEGTALRFIDERGFYTDFSGSPHPITLADYTPTPWVRDGKAVARLPKEERVVLLAPRSQPFLKDLPYGPIAARGSLPTGVVAGFVSVGLAGYAAGPDVRIVDRLGLADPIAARLRFGPIPGYRASLPTRYKAGHEKALQAEWIIARFADPQLPVLTRPRVAAAREALACDPLDRLLEAVEAPMTASRFLRNIGVAFELRDFRLPSDPQPARADVCRGG